MFPLGMVVFPGSRFTLRVFEGRYLELVEDCVDNELGFGVSLIAKGHEVGGGDERYEYGTLSRIVEIANIGAGQLMISCVGEKRFRVLEWIAENPYPMATIEFEEAKDIEDVESDQIDELKNILSRTADTVSELSGFRRQVQMGAGPEPTDQIYYLAENSYLGAYDKYQVLAAKSLKERFNLLSELLTEVDEMYQAELALRNQSD